MSTFTDNYMPADDFLNEFRPAYNDEGKCFIDELTTSYVYNQVSYKYTPHTKVRVWMQLKPKVPPPKPNRVLIEFSVKGYIDRHGGHWWQKRSFEYAINQALKRVTSPTWRQLEGKPTLEQELYAGIEEAPKPAFTPIYDEVAATATDRVSKYTGVVGFSDEL